MKVLIVGYGSIAKKHIHVLRNIIPDVEIIALRSTTTSTIDDNIKSVYHWADVEKNIDFIIISNPPSEHYTTILEAINFGVPLFIEKPPLASLDGANNLVQTIVDKNILSYTAFNLRFHPVIVWLKENLETEMVLEVRAYCGSYLPDWRPSKDYRTIYSAKKNQGGGVHLDLIHELDYLQYLFGKPLSSNSFLSKKSELKIDSYDCAHYWLEYKRFNVSVLLNYYRRDAQRNLEIVCKDGTIVADLINHKVTKSSSEILFETTPDILKTYEVQLRYFIECISKNEQPMNSFGEALQTLKLCLK
jgi:predicted dehydrogenase